MRILDYFYWLPYRIRFNMKATALLVAAVCLASAFSWGYLMWYFLGAATYQYFKTLWLLFFDDTMNRVQYLPLGGGRYFYYLTRDTGGKGTPRFFKSFMRMTSVPWIQGNGYTFRIPKGLTFQVGVGRKVRLSDGEDGLAKALGAHPLNMPVEEIRDLEPSKLVKQVF